MKPLPSLLFITFLLFFAFYFGLSFYPLADNNEGMYAEIAREMLETKQFIIPHLNYLPYLEKPPLFYWLMTASMWLFGPTTFAARLIPATAALLTCLALVFWAYKYQRLPLGYLAAVILASSFGFIVIGHIVFFDMLLTLWLTLTMLAFNLWFHCKSKLYLYAAYAFLALAVLTKGVVALALALPIAVGYLLWMRVDVKTFLSFFNPIGIALFILIVTPWHILAQLQWHDFSRDYFINEQWMRFLDKRIPHDYYTGPIYYYLPRLLIYLLPWTLILCVGFLVARRKNIKPQSNIPKTIKPFLYLWFFIPLLFFSLSRAKANYYMIVGLPPLALLIAIWMQERFNKTNFVVSSIAGWTLPAVFVALWGLHAYQDNFSKYHFVHYFNEHHANTPLYLYQDYEKCSSLAFYMAKRLVMVDSKSKDLWYGQQTASPGWFLSIKEFLQRPDDKYILVMEHHKKAFITAMQPQSWCEEITIGNTSLFTNVCKR